MIFLQKIKTGFAAGITAAILDISGAIIVFAFILKLTTTEKLLQSVAAGAFGKNAYEGGWQMALAGLFFHTCIAISFAFFYLLIYPAYKKIISNPVIAGFIYGCFVWCVMNILVLKIIVGKPITAKYIFPNISILIIMVGIPIAVITDKYFKKYG